ncbi:MAG: hypothetical protein EU532_14550 [Promethearchaeota archaeon]|nr:MAG: hypothetical protein EU532_14550 [Candidatus Lokiarchaeota archaeon]
MSIGLKQTRLIENNILFVIKSWGELLGYPTLGKYVNHYVSNIQTDLVIFLGGLESTIPIKKSTELETEQRALHYLFGIGYYYTKFELQSGRYITDNRELTGLILSDFVYDYLATSKNITLEDDRDVIISDKLFKVPIDLSNKSNTQKTFIKGAFMRNFFIPYKDVFLEFMETIQKPSSYQLGQGHTLLSTHWDYFNKILISTEMMKDKRTKIMSPTAGINEIILGSDRHLKTIFNSSERQEIYDKILHLKDIYAKLDFDPMYLFSLIDNASHSIITKPSLAPRYQTPSKSENILKESIFISAQSRRNTIVDWPEKLKRNTKEELESLAVYKEFKEHPPTVQTIKSNTKDTSSPIEFGKERITEEEKFELRTQKRPSVEFKKLPLLEKDDVFIILLYLKEVVEKDYDIQSIGKAFGIARDRLRNIILQSKFMWEISKYENLYSKFEEPNIGLSLKEKNELLDKINLWIENVIKQKDDFIEKKSD